jgi:MoxR-like ATPase
MNQALSLPPITMPTNGKQPNEMPLTELREKVSQLRARLNAVLLGKSHQIELVLACLFARGHLLLDDLPGTGKTTLAKSLADSLGGKFGRLQCTPDLLPTDITGFSLFNQKSREFEFHPGPVFSDILLADEINRTTPRTQSALLEAMAERQVTIDAVGHRLIDTFFVIATQNPIDSHGAYPLPEAQLDRFAMRLEIGYPDRAAQLAMLSATPSKYASSTEVAQRMTVDELRQLQRVVAAIHVHEKVRGYIVDLVDATRQHESISLGISPRGMLVWQRVAQAWAFLQGRDFVTPGDVQDVALPTLSVRLVTRTGNSTDVIQTLMRDIPAPDYR